jgi:hypothetical protein
MSFSHCDYVTDAELVFRAQFLLIFYVLSCNAHSPSVDRSLKSDGLIADQFIYVKSNAFRSIDGIFSNAASLCSSVLLLAVQVLIMLAVRCSSLL